MFNRRRTAINRMQPDSQTTGDDQSDHPADKVVNLQPNLDPSPVRNDSQKSRKRRRQAGSEEQVDSFDIKIFVGLSHRRLLFGFT